MLCYNSYLILLPMIALFLLLGKLFFVFSNEPGEKVGKCVNIGFSMVNSKTLNAKSGQQVSWKGKSAKSCQLWESLMKKHQAMFQHVY